MSKIKLAQFDKALTGYLGWCIYCKSFTRDATEPDAEGYYCPVCEEEAVMGAEQALLRGLITIIGNHNEL